MMKSLLLPGMLLSLLTLSGCGDLSKSPVKGKELDLTRFQAGCDLDMSKFAHFLSRNISNDLNCLKANLNLFIQLVKSERPGTMSRSAFETYLVTHRPDIGQDVVKAIRAVFQLNHLVTGDDPEFISKSNMEKVIDFAILFNQEAALNFAPIFRSEVPSTFSWHKHQRIKVLQIAGSVSAGFSQIFNRQREGRLDKLNIEELLNAFTTPETEDDIERFKKVLFVKKMLLGGNEEELTHLDIERFIYHFPVMAAVAYDVMRYEKIEPQTQESILNLLESDVHELSSIVLRSGGREEEHFFKMKQVYEAVEILAPGKFDLNKYSNLIKFGKKLVMGGNDDDVYGADFALLMNRAKEVIRSGRAFHRMYFHFKDKLNAKTPFKIDYQANKHLFPEHQHEFFTFSRIINDYRFPKGKNKSPIYSFEWNRNPEGVFESYLQEYVLNLVFLQYGSLRQESGLTFTHYMQQKQLKDLIKQLEKDLVGLGLMYPNTADGLADTVYLLGSLFQSQSSMTPEKEPVLDVNEASEFTTSLLAGSAMASTIRKRLASTCREDDYDRIEPDCFRANFLKSLCHEYRPKFPLLFSSLNVASCETLDQHDSEIQTYQDYSIRAAKTCIYYQDEQGNDTDEQVYYSEGEIMSILVAMMHIETTILRWDVNFNNIMDANEVKAAYKIYSPALDGFLENKPSFVKIFKEQIYLYMMKFEEIPSESSFTSIFKFIQFLTSSNQRVPAHRRTIASVLVNIAEENRKARQAKGEKPFPCNNLRQPDQWPEQDTESESALASTTY